MVSNPKLRICSFFMESSYPSTSSKNSGRQFQPEPGNVTKVKSRRKKKSAKDSKSKSSKPCEVELEDEANCKSILKKNSNKSLKVSFADEAERVLVSVQVLPSWAWKGVQAHNGSDIIMEYLKECECRETIVIDLIVSQLKMIRNNQNYSAVLNLYGVCITDEVLESLEVIFKMATFQCIIIYINNLCKTVAVDLFEMISFYDPVKELIICDSPTCFDSFIWDIISHTVRESEVLSALSFRQIRAEDHCFGILFNAINTKSNIVTLRFDGCDVGSAPNFNLVCYLDENTVLKELHLCHANLSHKEAEIFGKYIAQNSVLKILDLSNNRIGDRGLDALARALCEQAYRGSGIERLILVGNRITRASAITICNIIANCPLKVIDIGYNNISDVVLVAIKDDVAESKTLTFLGLDSTFISCTGLFYLAEACTRNRNMQHLNLRGNPKLHAEELSEICKIVELTGLTRIDIDESHRYYAYNGSVRRLRDIARANKSRLECSSSGSSTDCADDYLPDLSYSTIRSNTSSKPSFSGRFKVVAVPECPTSTSAMKRYGNTIEKSTIATAIVAAARLSTDRSRNAHVPQLNESGDLPKESAVQRDHNFEAITKE